MKVSVWDTYVKRDNGNLMHFDILVPSEISDETKVFGFGNLYLGKKPFKTDFLTTKVCKFCHIEQATQNIIDDIEKNGFSIIEMEHCN